jgi:GNAT superfamily N-acetyltransferase
VRRSIADGAAIRVESHVGPRSELRSLFELAEDSSAQFDAYIDEGRVLAVLESHQGHGIGRALMDSAVALARHEGRSAVVVATAAADIGNLRFYQRLGFRMRSIECDAVTEATGYDPRLEIDGIQLRDRVWLDLEP